MMVPRRFGAAATQRLCALALLIVLSPWRTSAAADSTSLSFTLARPATTSAGVYDDRGRLIRTLWRAEALPAGSHRRAWDGKDDGGLTYSGGEIEFKLIHHRVHPVWEGVVGNSSSARGVNSHRAFGQPTGFVGIGAHMLYAVGYNEWGAGVHRFLLAEPLRNVRPPIPTNDAFVSHSMLASDGLRLYWANTGGVSKSTFVGAFQLDNWQPSEFTAGQPICLNFWPKSTTRCYPGQFYANVIDLQTEEEDIPTGLAVQRQGRVLAIAHGGRGLVRLLDKSRGVSIGELRLPLAVKALNQLAMSPGGDLWVISGTTVQRYTGLDSQPRLVATINGLSSPLALATSESGDEGVWVADGGTSQQLKKFDRSGQLIRVIGVPGGCAGNPDVAADKLCFMAQGGRERTAVGVGSDGSVWVADPCNNRTLRFDPDGPNPGTSDEQIAYLPAVYTATVDHQQPQRVFANFLEFEIERGVALQTGKSWMLRRNWLMGLPPSLVDDRSMNNGFGGFTSVETLSNGRTYGVLAAQGRQVIVELPASGPLRVVKALSAPMPRTTAKVMYENGDLGYALTGPSTQTVWRQPLTGFDAAGDPVWSSQPIKLASVPTLPGSPHYRGAFSGMPPRFPVTGAGNVVFFDQSVTGNEGSHLGAARTDGTEWLWQASPTGALDGKGSFQTQRLDRSITYGGNAVWAHGRHIVYGYHGEFYKDLQNGKVGQANQFMHYDESGLFIGQFGQPSTRPAPADLAGLSGNAFSPTLVRDGDRLYLYHNDESSHGGIHRWRIDGWDDLVEMKGRGSVGSNIVLQ